MPSYQGTVEAEAGALRLDRYISEGLGLLSRSQVKIRSLEARLNGRPVKLSRMVKTGDRLDLLWKDPETPDLVPQDIPLKVIFENRRVIVVDKAQGMVVHPGAGNYRGTLVNALLFRRLQGEGSAAPIRAAESPFVPAGEGASAGAWPRPGIVHRLDKDTSGVMIAAWDDQALAFLSEQFKTRKVRKTYAAIVRGVPPVAAGRVETLISRDSRDRKRFAVSSGKGKYALTLYRLVRSWGTHSLLLLRPRTGRTHQIRVHLRYLGFPIAGDPLYGGGDSLFPDISLMLHAKSLALTLPGEENRRIFKSPLPARFKVMIARLNRRA
ncbi:MAG: RluA family pseudouridine synthase [Treponema sp.]|jgi:23S rRNA pseudouridine1911/1915/1917 synthase|nr:RluA family pseudouridine synthase [Treponema sp.]